MAICASKKEKNKLLILERLKLQKVIFCKKKNFPKNKLFCHFFFTQMKVTDNNKSKKISIRNRYLLYNGIIHYSMGNIIQNFWICLFYWMRLVDICKQKFEVTNLTRKNKILLIEVLTLLAESAPMKWFGRGFSPFCPCQILTNNGIKLFFEKDF